MAPAAAPAPAAKEADKKVQLMKEVRAHEVAIGELNNLPPSRAVYQKTGNLFFGKSVKSAVASEQKQLDASKARLQKLDQA
uniref:Prefoldin subunit 1 n=1 Tax=Oryza brachyantha TaxID=4533 RepID=J3MKJ0_ORYBR